MLLLNQEKVLIEKYVCEHFYVSENIEIDLNDKKMRVKILILRRVARDNGFRLKLQQCFDILKITKRYFVL